LVPGISPTRRWFLAVALGFIAFAIYGSLLPFEVQPVPVAAAWDAFRVAMTSWPRRVSRSDVLANVLLFVPIGFALTGALVAGGRSRLAAAGAGLMALPLAAAISLLCEFLQMFARGRIPSNVDVGAQSVGTALGAVMFVVLGQALAQWIHETTRAEGNDRVARILGLFAFGWLFGNLAPFDITVDPGNLADRLQSGHIGLTFLQAPNTTAIRQLWDVVAEIVSAVPLGLLAIVIAARHFRSPLTGAILLGVSLVVAVEAAQIFIKSHAAYATDALFGAIGVAIGAGAGRRLFATETRRLETSQLATAAMLMAGAAIALLFAYHWQPFDFTADTELVRRKLARFSLIPFAAYSMGSYLNALKNVLVDLALSAPLGVSLALLSHRTSIPRRLVSAMIAGGTVALYAVIELGQFLLPTRTPDVTDILIGSTAVYVSVGLGRWAVAGLSPGPNRAADGSGALEGVERREQQLRTRGDV
jgi:VanZ family protein